MAGSKSPLLGQLTPVPIINKYVLICLDQMCFFLATTGEEATPGLKVYTVAFPECNKMN